jgi:hypothetical protein
MARASGRGKIPRILMNGHAAAYSSRCRIREAERYHRQNLFVKQNDAAEKALSSATQKALSSRAQQGTLVFA